MDALERKVKEEISSRDEHISMLDEHIEKLEALLVELEQDKVRLDYLIAEAMYEGNVPEERRSIIDDDPHGIALVIGGAVEWPDGCRAEIEAKIREAERRRINLSKKFPINGRQNDT